MLCAAALNTINRKSAKVAEDEFTKTSVVLNALRLAWQHHGWPTPESSTGVGDPKWISYQKSALADAKAGDLLTFSGDITSARNNYTGLFRAATLPTQSWIVFKVLLDATVEWYAS